MYWHYGLILVGEVPVGRPFPCFILTNITGRVTYGHRDIKPYWKSTSTIRSSSLQIGYHNCPQILGCFLNGPTNLDTGGLSHYSTMSYRREVDLIVIQIIDIDRVLFLILGPTVPEPAKRIVVDIFILKVLPPRMCKGFHGMQGGP